LLTAIISLICRYTKLRKLEERLDIPTVRKPRLPKEVIQKTAASLIESDITQGNGPSALEAVLHNELVLIPW
jgi:hypothetical protein